MSYSSTGNNRRQGEKSGDTGLGEFRLTDPRFDWRGKRKNAVWLAWVYHVAGLLYDDQQDKISFERYSGRTSSCCTHLEFEVFDAPTGQTRRLHWANFCNVRLCPVCMARRARVMAVRLSQLMDAVQAETGCQFIFVTLTMKNVDGEHLGAAVTQLTTAWDRLRRQSKILKAWEGWFRALEITRGVGKNDKLYHPHLHVIVAVQDSYFKAGSPLYVTHQELIERWRRALRVDYDPSVRIQRTTSRKGGKGKAFEAAKYTVKSADYLGSMLADFEAAERVKDYSLALYHRRLTAMGGTIKETARRLKLEELETTSEADLIHADDQAVREDVATMMEIYRWSLGAGDYILTAAVPLGESEGVS